MSDNDKLNEELDIPKVDPMSKLLVSNIFKKHGVTQDKMKKLSDEEKELFIGLIKEVQEKSQAIVDSQNQSKNKTITEKNITRTQKQNTRREQLLEQLRQRRQNNSK
ncbi:spore coat protein [Bacillus subtilis]|uniref:spore coat protein n=1 Tax=Bacillus subtilis TaxID=1423 RepID=UPI000E76ED04|nr:spore coat protein [Bacillus subtilis]MDF4198371.1 spore coat protein [Bacillus subtilis]MDF4216100.1 spore coat protein [Bacillus subtilis]MEC2135286.1 spore coat protein [Bacillus subtilis]RJS52166.1 spore coat protein [Bacillus subtilis]UQZ51997.1 spore coat protein [Bacillus subtilis]